MEEKMNNVVLVHPGMADEACQAVEILQDEIQKRTGLTLDICDRQGPDSAFIAVGTAQTLSQWAELLDALETPGAEGFRLKVICREPLQVLVCGADRRGCLYGCGQLLRKLELLPGVIRASSELDSCSVTPKYALRGHQLAYRDKQNTCPNWTADEFDAYIRTLALFGANAIEILPPRTDDRLFSPLFHTHPLEMMTALSERIHAYGLDVWLWYPNMAHDYTDPETMRRELEEREQVFAALPYLDAILIPAGDPGELKPRTFFAVTEQMMKIAHQHHPDAKVFVAPQSFAPEDDWYDAFYTEIRREPEWLYGVCYAPWIGDTLPEMVQKLPTKYRSRIRHYPDITHTAASQFEVPLWDAALAMVHGRESCCPRPQAMKLCHNLHAPYCIGSLTYCEGIHDDVNKFLWTDQDVDPERSAESLVQDYVRLLIDPEHVDEITELIFALEDNWKGDLLANKDIAKVLQRFDALNGQLRPEVKENWRYVMLYQCAMLDAYVQKRRAYDSQLEQEAKVVLASAAAVGADRAIRSAREIFNRTYNEPVAEELRFQLQALGQKLFETPGCRMQQSSVWHNGQAWIRGAWLDTLNMPLNDMQFYCASFDRILRLTDEEEKLGCIEQLLHRTDAGEGGVYIALGDLHDFQKYVLPEKTYEQDPGFLRSPHLFHDLYGLMMAFHADRGWHNEFPIPLSWAHRARTIYGTPLRVRIEGLVPGQRYRLKVTYPDMIGSSEGKVDAYLFANGQLIHDAIACDEENGREPIYQYELPPVVQQDGALLLEWKAYHVLRPISVAELWLQRI